MNTTLTTNETFYYNFLMYVNLNYRGANLKVIAQIMNELENEFQKYPNGFYKHYGDDVLDQRIFGNLSWKKLLNISRDTFNNGFEKIGTTHKENDFKGLSIHERFNSKYYCRVKNDYKNRTFYYRNNELLDERLNNYRKILIKGSLQTLEIKA